MDGAFAFKFKINLHGTFITQVYRIPICLRRNPSGVGSFYKSRTLTTVWFPALLVVRFMCMTPSPLLLVETSYAIDGVNFTVGSKPPSTLQDISLSVCNDPNNILSHQFVTKILPIARRSSRFTKEHADCRLSLTYWHAMERRCMFRLLEGSISVHFPHAVHGHRQSGSSSDRSCDEDPSRHVRCILRMQWRGLASVEIVLWE